MCRDIKNFVSSPDGSLYDVTDEFDSAQDYYRQKLYREALFHYYAFLDFVGKECKCDKQIEEAKYKIAKCYLALNSNEAAMQALKAYLDEFPKGKYSREALKEYRKIHLAAGGL
jgi:tetratricopeptide (TPR) repeat protein